jgi:hypothetical protein
MNPHPISLRSVAMKSTIFWDITPCSPLRFNLRFGGTECLPPAFTLVSCLAHFLDPEDGGVISSSGTSVDTRTTRCYIPEDGTLHNHRCENLKSYISCNVILLSTSRSPKWCLPFRYVTLYLPPCLPHAASISSLV